MWVPGNRPTPRVQRTTSVHSIGSVQSPSQSRSPSTTGLNRSSTNYSNNDSSNMKNFDLGTAPPARRSQHDQPVPVHIKAEVVPSFPQIVQKDRWEVATEDDISSRSSTLDGEEEYMEHHAMKKPAQSMLPRKDLRNEEPRSPNPAPHVPGPLESQLAALMSKLIYLEQSNPAVSVSPEEYQDMQKRLKTLEEEKKTWWKRHEAIWALRDEDVENNIKIRVSDKST
jgi:hypothetical protein